MFTLKQVKYKNILHIEEMNVSPNKVTCITGESGSGKSTLLKLLNMMITPDEGNIYFQDELLKHKDPIAHRREVVMLLQSPLVFPGNVEENLQIGLRFSEKGEASKEELQKVLEIVCLDKQLEDEIDHLSGGEKQRVALARILLMKPAVYLLDEPTSALDEETESIVMDNFIREVRKEKGTIIMVTHSKKVAESYADEIITMKK